MSEPTWTDQHLDQVLGNLLRIGVVSAALVVLAGAVVHLGRHGTEPMPSYAEFHGERSSLRSLEAIVADAFALNGQGIIQLGILVLIATPIARVVFSVFAFALQGDHIYVVVTLIVLAALLYSLFSGTHV